MRTLGKKTKQEIIKQISGLLEEHMPEIDEAYLNAPKSFSISLGVKFSPSDIDESSNDVDTSISYTPKKVSDSTHGTVSEKQETMFKE